MIFSHPEYVRDVRLQNFRTEKVFRRMETEGLLSPKIKICDILSLRETEEERNKIIPCEY